MKIRIETWSTETNECETVKIVDFSNRNIRQWITKHTAWALQNSRGVVIRPEHSPEKS